MSVEFRVLGPLEVVVGGVPRSVGARRPRAVLAALLLHPNRVVPIAKLIDIVWGESAPRSAAMNLRTHVAGLRRALAPEGEQRLLTRDGGYLISSQPTEVDLSCFEDFVARGRHAHQAGEHAIAAEWFGAALRLWRGCPFDGVELHGPAAAEVARLTETRLTLTEDHLRARLAAGDGTVVGELRGLVVTQPLREPAWALLMLALYRTGRQADALAAYDQARDWLADELGINPGSALRTLRQQILTGDPALLDDSSQNRVRTTAPANRSTEHALAAVAFSCTQLGKPYIWGGNGSPGFDCSGLTHAAYAATGITIPRTAHAQYHAGPRLPAHAPLMPGDLVFAGTPSRIHHVGISLGGTSIVNVSALGTPVQVDDLRDFGDYAGASRPTPTRCDGTMAEHIPQTQHELRQHEPAEHRDGDAD